MKSWISHLGKRGAPALAESKLGEYKTLTAVQGRAKSRQHEPRPF